MHPIQCKCGQVAGEVIMPTPSNRARCYCSDCRAFGHFFGPNGSVVDAQGGTEIIQVPMDHVRFSQGIEHLAAIRLSEKGMLRWYAACCQTPIGNTMADRRWSFVGLIHSCLDAGLIERDFGARVATINTDSALGDPKPRQQGLFRSILGLVRIALPARLSGRYRQSPFFTPAGEPLVVPRVLTAGEVEKLKRSP